MKKKLLSINARHFCCIALLVSTATLSRAQGNTLAGVSSDSFTAFAHKVQQAYSKAAHLGFHLKYYYANAGRPGQYIDSLTGEVEMDKGRSYMVIDGMETLLTSRYSIHVVGDEKLIYLAAPGHGDVQNPVGMLDSLFAHIAGVTARLENRDGADILTILFPPGQPYTRMEISVDAKTGYFRRITYAIETRGLVSEDMIERPGHAGPYQSSGQVDILFTDYQKGHFDDQLFREDNFFTRSAKGFEPALRYKDYHIYLASSNL